MIESLKKEHKRTVRSFLRLKKNLMNLSIFVMLSFIYYFYFIISRAYFVGYMLRTFTYYVR